MEDKKMIEYKETFISKIKKFFKKLFSNKNKANEEQTQVQEEIQIEESESKQEESTEEKKNTFFNEIKINSDEITEAFEKKAFLEEINGNPEKLSMLSIDRLKKLEKYYDDVIKQNDEKIKKLKSSI